MDDKKEQLIALKAEWAQFYDNLAGAVNTEAGNLLIMQIQNKINEKQKSLVSVSLQPLEYPYYEYPRDDLQKMKAIRAQISSLEELKSELNYEYLIEKTKTYRSEIEDLKSGVELEPIY